jgi:hypothetical protein
MRSRRGRSGGPWTVGAGAALLAFLGVEVALILTVANGPTLDEGIYLTAGRRTLDGSGIADGYLSWFAGSLLWPVVAGLSDHVAGLAGARVAAAVFIAIGLAATWRAAVVLFGRKAGFFTALAALTTGPVIAIGHLAVVDAPAVAGLGIAFWATTELVQRDHRVWLVTAALAYAFAVLAKYPVAACGLPLLLLIAVLRRRRAAMDIVIFGAVASAILVTFFLSQRGQLGYFVGWRAENNPTFGVTRPMVAVSQAWNAGLPLLLATAGLLACRRKAVGAILLLGALLFPLYHLGTGSPVGDSKHVVFGCVFTLPLIGLLFSRIARGQFGITVAACLVVAMGALGFVQAQRLDGSWMDVGPATDYLAEHARPGDKFLIDNAWPFTRRLYAERKVSSPWAVYDVYRMQHGQNDTPICRFDWFVAAQGAGTWPRRIVRAVRACGTFRRVLLRREPVIALGRDLNFVSWEAGVEIFRNTARSGRR